MSANLERLLKAAGQAAPTVKPTLETNPSHALVTRLNSESDEDRFADWANLLFEQALLAEGGQLDDPKQRGQVLHQQATGSGLATSNGVRSCINV